MLVAACPGLQAQQDLPPQQTPIQVAVGTPLPVVLGKHVPMKKGAPLDCKLLYPVYVDNRLVIPKGSVVEGSVIALKSDRSRRIHGRLWGDFTPFHTPVVRFDRLEFPDGTTEKIVSDDAADGAPVLHLSTPVAKTPRSLIGQQIAQLKDQLRDTVAVVTAPGRGDRMVQFLYTQLPYHPERINAGTMWTVTLVQPLTLTAAAKPGTAAVPASGPASTPAPTPAVQPKPIVEAAHPVELEKRPSGVPDAVPRGGSTAPATEELAAGNPTAESPKESAKPAEEPKPWHLSAYLSRTINSANEKAGNTFDAVVAEPVFAPDHSIAVPEGSVLVGTITEAKPARFFGRSGKLRFDFRELKLPGSDSPQQVLGTLAGADTNQSQDLKIDEEGGVQSKPKNRIIVPLVLTLLAGRALDDDGSAAGNAAVASNGFGIIGRVVGIVAGSRGLAAGIGYYAAALSFYERWLVCGQNVVFVKNTRIEVTTTARQNLLSVPKPK